MNILVVGGMHGNEPLGPAVVALFRKNPQPGVSVAIANAPALKKNCRFITQDLNRSFPGKARGNAEQRRAKQLLALCKQFDIVLDFHNTHCPGNDCGFVGQTASPKMYQAAWVLGLKRMIVADYDCINKYAPNCLSVEISLDSPQNQAAIWYERITQLARLTNCPANEQLERYRFVYRLTLDDKARFNLKLQDFTAFQPIKPELAKALGLKSPAYSIFVADSYTPYNFGGLLYKVKDARI